MKLQSLYEGMVKGATLIGLQATLASKITRHSHLDEEADIQRISSEINELHLAYCEAESSGTLDDLKDEKLLAFKNYIEAQGNTIVEDGVIEVLSKRLRNIHLGKKKRDMRFMLARALGVYQVTNGVVEWNNAESLNVEVSALLGRLWKEVTESGRTITIPNITTLVTEIVGQQSVEATVKSLSNRELKQFASFVKHTREMATKLESKDTKILLKSDCNKEGLVRTNGILTLCWVMGGLSGGTIS